FIPFEHKATVRMRLAGGKRGSGKHRERGKTLLEDSDMRDVNRPLKRPHRFHIDFLSFGLSKYLCFEIGRKSSGNAPRGTIPRRDLKPLIMFTHGRRRPFR